MKEPEFSGLSSGDEEGSADEVEGDFLGNARVAIAGLGLMGGSLALALQGRCRELRALDPDPATRRLAERRRIVDFVTDEPSEALSGADVIVLAAPVGAILTLIRQLPGLHPGSPVVLDLGSTKAEICRLLEQLPNRFAPVGGHPMCGKETSGLAQADPKLFEGAPFAFVPLSNTTRKARALADRLAGAIGARPVWLDAETHDRWTAATSHLPYLLSLALTLATPQEAAPLAGSGFQSATRLADSSPRMMHDILDTNREPVLDAMARLRRELDRLEAVVRSGQNERLLELLQAGPEQRKVLLTLE